MEVVIERDEITPFLFCPFFARSLTNQVLQFVKGAGLRKFHGPDPVAVIKS